MGRWVPERDQKIERLDLARKQLLEKPEELRHGHRPRAVRDDEKHALAGKGQRCQARAYDLTRLFRGQESVGVADAGSMEFSGPQSPSVSPYPTSGRRRKLTPERAIRDEAAMNEGEM
jgi:hypothetical protein